MSWVNWGSTSLNREDGSSNGDASALGRLALLMRYWIPAISGLLALAFSVSPASACRVYRPPAEYLATHLTRPYETIVTATILEVEPRGEGGGPWWRATFQIGPVLKGREPDNKTLRLQEMGGFGMCWRVPTPVVGERWIVFLAHAEDETGFSYPEALLPNDVLVAGLDGPSS